MKGRGVWALATTALACGSAVTTPGEVLLGPGPGQDLQQQGPYGVAWRTLDIPARHTDVITTEVYYPSDADGVVAAGGPWPALMVLQEDNIPTSVYAPVASHLASWGLVVGLPRHPLDLVSTAPDNALIALDAIREVSAQPGSFLGGGVAGDRAGLMRYQIDAVDLPLVEQDGRFTSLALVGAAPVGTSRTLIKATSLLGLGGGRDCVADPSIGWPDYQVRRVLALVTGVSHPQFGQGELEGSDDWCDSAAQECANACQATLPQDQARPLLLGVLAAFHTEALQGREIRWDELSLAWPEISLTETEPSPTPSP